MAERTDITYTQTLSPRVAEIAAPSTEIVMQDYVDTTRVEEARFRSMGFPALISASGKQDLGGGTLVAITVQEENLQLAFQPRFTPAVTGTVTTGSGPPNLLGRVTFTDTAADFVTANVQPGSYMINWTKQSVTDVVRVVDSDTLETRAPQNGSDDEWTIGDSYSLWNITQVRTSGGNLVAVDENGASISAILPTWGTQVILTTSSSATIQELEDIQFASYNNGVTIDLANKTGKATSGTVFPAGTLRQPSDNWTDTLAIANEVGLSKFYVLGDATIPLVLDFTDFVFEGESRGKTTLTILDGSLLNGSEFVSATLTGTFTSGNKVELRDCEIDMLSNIYGSLYDCGMEGTNSLVSGVKTEIVRGYSEVAGGAATNILDINNAELFIRDYQGGIELRGKNGISPVSIDMSSGQVIVNDNNSAGEITLRGIAKWTNESTYAGTTTIQNEMINLNSIPASVWNALSSAYTAAGSFGQLVGRKLLTISKFVGLGRQ